MRCRYAEIPCPVVGGFACFRCINCQKQMSLPASMRDQLERATAVLPDCTATVDRGEAAVQEVQNAAAGAAAATAGTQPENQSPALSPPTAVVWDPAGAGTQLKKLLAHLGIKSTENCSCNTRARIMNERGIEWCEQNVSEIVGWLKEEAARRNLPFLAFPTKVLVQRAIKVAKRVRDKAAAAIDDTAAT